MKNIMDEYIELKEYATILFNKAVHSKIENYDYKNVEIIKSLILGLEIKLNDLEYFIKTENTKYIDLLIEDIDKELQMLNWYL